MVLNQNTANILLLRNQDGGDVKFLVLLYLTENVYSRYLSERKEKKTQIIFIQVKRNCAINESSLIKLSINREK